MKRNYLNYKKALLGAVALSTSLAISGCGTDKTNDNYYNVEKEDNYRVLVYYVNDKAIMYKINEKYARSIDYSNDHVCAITENYGVIEFPMNNVVIFDNIDDANLFALSIVEDNDNIIYMDSMIENGNLRYR